MKIVGMQAMTSDQLKFEIERGARFILFQYCISLVVVTLKRPSSIYLFRAGESRLGKILGFSAISLLLGWWGIPWGPIYTIGTLVTNLRGGKDVTKEVLAAVSRPAAPRPAPDALAS